MFDLRAWLRRRPKPAKLRIATSDGDERIIELGKGRYLWNEVESTVRASGAVSVECLDADGSIIRATPLAGDDADAPTETKEEKSASRAMRDQAAMLDAYGRRINEAHEKGAESASKSQDKLVELVEVLTGHLAVAITNVNNLSVNLSNALQAAGGASDAETNPNMALLGQFMGMVLAKNGAAPAAAEAPTNGRAKKP